MTSTLPSTGYVVVWTCYCSDAADDSDTLPERCPEHDRPLMAPPWKNTLPGGVLKGHTCWTDDVATIDNSDPDGGSA